MTAKQLKRLGTDDELRKRLAKLMAQRCFRNTELERLHEGTTPGSLTGDYSDVKVVTPYGEIPWTQLSRISDDEMKVLMIDVVNKTYTYLSMLFTTSPEAIDAILDGLAQADSLPQWDDPEITWKPS